MNELRRLIPVMQRVLASEVILGPALASAGVGGLDRDAYDIVCRHASELAREIGAEEPFSLTVYRSIQVTPPLVEAALVEAISSTAAYLSHIRLGYLKIDEAMILVAHRLVKKVFLDFGRDDVLTLSFIVNAYDNCKVIYHYGRVLVAQFVTGELHRPWIQYALDLELTVHLLTETMKVVVGEDDKQYVMLTDGGLDRYRKFADFLRDSGFLRRRADLARRSQFSQLEEYDAMMDTISRFAQVRDDILNASGIGPGMRVLELGCGTGGMTLTAGLYKMVGSQGQLIATDPSVGMLARAREKLRLFPDEHVQFVEAAAEELPFDDNSFDAVVGCEFLHFTDIPRVLQEVHRVSKPGATFTTIYSLDFPQTNEFFLEWFAPVLLSNSPSHQNTALPSEATVKDAIAQFAYESVRIEPYDVVTYYQYPEWTVRFTVQVGNFFAAAMEELPWIAQQDMIHMLIERGHGIVQKYGANQLTQIHPSQFLQARVVK